MASTFINGTSAYAYLTIGSTRIEPGSIAVDPGLSIVQTLCGEDGYGIGGFASSQLTVSIARSALPQEVAGQEIAVYMGFQTGGTEDNPTYTTVPVGKFYATPDKVVTKGIFTTITAYDASYYATGQYLVSSTPATVGALVSDVISKAGLTLASNAYAGLTRPTSTPVRDNMNGLTYRDVIAHCALLLGANACITREGKLRFVVPGSTSVKSYGAGDYIYENYSLQSNAAYVMGRLEVQYPHEVITGAGTEDQETEEVTDTFIYQASGTTSQRGIQLTTTEIRTQAEANALGTALFGSKGLEIYGYSLGVGGRPEIDLGDMITLEDDFGKVMKLYVFSHQITFNGAMSSVFAANVPESDMSSFDSSARPMLADQIKALTSTVYDAKRLIVDSIVATEAKIDTLTAKAITTDKLNAGTAEIKQLITKNVDTDTISARVVDSTQLKSTYATIENLNTEKGRISALESGKVDVDMLNATNANVRDLVAGSINGNVITEGTIIAKALSHDAIETISGIKVYYDAEEPRTDYGKNLLQIVGATFYTNRGVTAIDNHDGSITFTGTFTETGFGGIVAFPSVSLNGSYTLSVDKPMSNVKFTLLDSSYATYGTIIEGTTYKTFSATDRNVIRLCVSGAVGAVVNVTIKPMLEKGSTATPYEPYAPTDKDGHVMRDGDTWYRTLVVNADQDPLITINDNCKDTYDSNTGLITRRVGKVDMSTLNWGGYDSSAVRVYAPLTDAKIPTSTIEVANILSDKFITKSLEDFFSSGDDYQMCLSNGGNLSVRIKSCTSRADYIQAMQGVMLYYELATPYTEQGTSYSDIMSIWDTNSTRWIATPLDGAILRANSITAQEIATNAINATHIQAKTLDINCMDDSIMSANSDQAIKRGRMQWINDTLKISSKSEDGTAEYSTEVGGDGIKFKYNGVETASIDQDKLKIGKTVVLTDMVLGKWAFSIASSGHLIIRWNGGV